MKTGQNVSLPFVFRRSRQRKALREKLHSDFPYKRRALIKTRAVTVSVA